LQFVGSRNFRSYSRSYFRTAHDERLMIAVERD